MAIAGFTPEELQTLKAGEKFTTQELFALESGAKLTLNLYIRARTFLGANPYLLLEGEVQELMSKVFLMFTVLQQKHIVSIEEMQAMALRLDKEASNADRNQPPPPQAAAPTGGGRTVTFPQKDEPAN